LNKKNYINKKIEILQQEIEYLKKLLPQDFLPNLNTLIFSYNYDTTPKCIFFFDPKLTTGQTVNSIGSNGFSHIKWINSPFTDVILTMSNISMQSNLSDNQVNTVAKTVSWTFSALKNGTNDCIGTINYQLSFNDIPDTTHAQSNRIAKTNVCFASGIFAKFIQASVIQTFEDGGIRIIEISIK
jgi:hypothetical protein